MSAQGKPAAAAGAALGQDRRANGTLKGWRNIRQNIDTIRSISNDEIQEIVLWRRV